MSSDVSESQLRRLCEELETRLRAGQQHVCEQYLNRPEIGSDEESALELIYREWTVLEELGQRPETEAFVNRFPKWKEGIYRLLEVHDAFADPTTDRFGEQGSRSGADFNAEPFSSQGLGRNREPSGQEPGRHEAFDPIGTLIGKYKVLQEIGEGGFGIVYMAEQQEPIRRKVALKIVKPGMDTRAAIARFEAERQALAMMEHPNICRVLDAGATPTGRPYFVMDLVKGIPISEFCDKRNLSTVERLQLFKTVCDAVQHAHSKGIIHRDLKPSNVMITLHDGIPVPKIIDFGIAKALNQQLTDKTLFTRYGQMLGTPMYMSPEQAEMSGLDIDIRSDIYSLGVLLYELLTGTPPLSEEKLRTASYSDLIKMIMEDDPPTPSTRLQTLGDTITDICSHRDTNPKRLSTQLRGDLDRIVMKALEKDRRRRYETVKDLAGDVNRFLNHQPVHASSPGPLYRIGKFTRRNKALVFSTTAVLLALSLGFLLAVTGWLSAREQQSIAQIAEQSERTQRKRAQIEEANARAARDEERVQRERVETSLYFQQISRAHREWQSGELQNATQILAECAEAKRGWEWHYLQRQCHSSEKMMRGHSTVVRRVKVSPDGKWIASCSNRWNDRRPGEAIIWNRATGQPAHIVGRQPGGVRDIAFSPDSRLLAGVNNSRGGLHVWTVDTGSLVYTHTKQSFEATRFRPDGKQLAASGVDGKVYLFDAASGQLQQTLGTESSRIFDIDYHPDGHLLAGVTHSGTINLWDTQTGARLHQLPHSGNRTVDFSPNGKLLATGGYSGANAGRIQIFELAGSVVRPIAEHITNFGSVGSVLFSPDSQFLALTSTDARIRFWKPISGHELRSFRAHDGITTALDFGPDGRHLVTGGTDREVKSWTLSHADSNSIQRTHAAFSTSLAFNPNSNVLALAGGLNRSSPGRGKKTVQLWGLPDRGGENLVAELEGFDQWMSCVAYSPDGTSIAVGGDQGGVRVWDTNRGIKLVGLDAHSSGVSGVRFSHDAKLLVTGSRDGTVRVWNANTGRSIRRWSAHAGGVRCVDQHPQLGVTATVGVDGRLSLWRTESASELPLEPPSDQQALTFVAFSKDGSRLATGDETGKVHLWSDRNRDPTQRSPSIVGSVPQYQHQQTYIGHTDTIAGLTFHPGNRRLASMSVDGSVVVWDLDSDHEAIRLRPDGQNDHLLAIEFSGDGQRLAAARGGGVTLWNAAPYVERQPGSLIDQQQKLAWHLENAESCSRQRNWQGVLFHCDRLLANDPDSAKTLAMRGSAFAALGDWQPALDDCTRAMQLGENQIDGQYALALLQLQLGDEQAYRGTCRTILASLLDPKSDSRYNIDLVAKICALAPDSVPDLTYTIGFLSRRADRSIGYARHVYQNILGMILLRSDRYEEAIRHIHDGLPHATAQETPHDWLVLALANHQLGRHDLARAWFEQAAWSMEHMRASSQRVRSDWKERLETQMLRDEVSRHLDPEPSADRDTPENQEATNLLTHWSQYSDNDRRRVGWHLNELHEAELNRDHLAAIEHLNELIVLRPRDAIYYLRRSRAHALRSLVSIPTSSVASSAASSENSERREVSSHWQHAIDDYQQWQALQSEQTDSIGSFSEQPRRYVPADTFELHSIEHWMEGDWQTELDPTRDESQFQATH